MGEDEIEIKNPIDMTGVWFVYLGVGTALECSRIITMNGLYDKDTLITDIIKAVYDSFDDDVKKYVDEHGRLCIRNMTRIG